VEKFPINLGGLLLLGVALTACPDDEKLTPDQPDAALGGTPPAATTPGTCEGRVPDPTAPLSSVAGSGVVTEGKWTVALASVVSGYANLVPQSALKNGNEELRITLSTSPNACGRVRRGVVRSGEPTLVIELASYQGTKFEAGRSYPSTRIGIDGVREGLPPGPCNGVWPLDANSTNPKGTLVLTAIDNTHVVGRYYVLPPGADAGVPGAEPLVAVEFDVPFCGNTVVGAPPQCCVP
jgi:hypothetical protein